MDDEFEIGDVLVEIGVFGEWIVVDNPDDRLKYCMKANGPTVVGDTVRPSIMMMLKELAERHFVKVNSMDSAAVRDGGNG